MAVTAKFKGPNPFWCFFEQYWWVLWEWLCQGLLSACKLESQMQSTLVKNPNPTNQPKKPPQRFLNCKCGDRTYWIPEPFWMLNLTFWDFIPFLSAFMKNISVFHLSHVINWILVILTGFLAPGMYLLTTPWIRSWEPDCVNGSRHADCKDSLVFCLGGSDPWSS